MKDLVNSIANADRTVGWMALQICDSAEEEKWYPALASLFMLTEQVLRWVTDAREGEKLSQIIDRAHIEGFITNVDTVDLHTLRKYRNEYLHANFHANTFPLDGLLYSVNESETAQAVFEILSIPCLHIIYKLTESNNQA